MTYQVLARRKDRIEALARRLRADTGAAVEVVVADLTNKTALAAVESRAASDAVELVVNNAGFGGYGRFATLDPSVADQLIDVHVRATTRIARAAIGSFLARGRGAVINIASTLSLSGTLPVDPLPARVVYGAAKAYLLAFTQLLAGELAATNVRLQVCLPAIVATEFHTLQGIDLSHMPRMTPDDVVHASLAALARNEVVCIPALEDPALVDRIGDAQRAVIAASRGAQLPARYR